MNLSLGLEVSRSRTIGFFVNLPSENSKVENNMVRQLNPPLSFWSKVEVSNEPLPWVRSLKIGNNMVFCEPPS